MLSGGQHVGSVSQRRAKPPADTPRDPQPTDGGHSLPAPSAHTAAATQLTVKTRPDIAESKMLEYPCSPTLRYRSCRVSRSESDRTVLNAS